MNNNYTINIDLVKKIVSDRGFFYIEAKKFYGEDYVGPKYIIVTDMTDFTTKFPKYSEMVIVSVEMFIRISDAINQSVLNDRRERFRQINLHNNDGYIEDYDDQSQSKNDRNGILSIKNQIIDPVAELAETHMIRETLLNALDQLNEHQRKRLYSYFFEGKTQRDIAREEGVNRNAVEKSIYSGLKKLKDLL